MAYNGDVALGDRSKYGQGTYEHIGTADGSAIYAQSEEDNAKHDFHTKGGGWSVIFINWHTRYWMGTVTFFTS